MYLKNAISILQKELRSDADYHRSWVANIAMAYKDAERWYIDRNEKKTLNKEDKHIIANEAAEHFISLLCLNSEAEAVDIISI